MSNHTQEPWVANGWFADEEHNIEIYGPNYDLYVFGGPDGDEIVLKFGSPREEKGKANLRRLLACVNACKGIPVEALESGVVADLLAACEAAIGSGQLPPNGPTIKTVRAAVAKAKGGA